MRKSLLTKIKKMDNKDETFFPFKPSRKQGEHYVADATIIWCFDGGFSDVLDKFIEARGWRRDRVDIIKFPGGVKSLVSPAKEAHCETLFWEVQTSIRLHHSPIIVLMLHGDCGAYGGAKAFDSDDKERENHEKELKEAMDYLKERLPADKEFEMWLSGFDGLRKV